MQLFQALLCFPQMVRIGYCIPIAIREKFLKTHVNPGMAASRNVLYVSMGRDCKLHVVSISPANNANSLDLLEREGFNLLAFVANEPECAYPTAIGECDVLAIWPQLPTRLLVFYRPIIMLKMRIALFPWPVGLAVLIEAGNRNPGTISTGLPGLRVKP